MKPNVVLSLVFGIFSVGAFANPVSFMDSFDFAPSVESARDDADTCANFEGSWKGTCTTPNGQQKEETVTIKQQNCQLIHVGNEKHKISLPIGGSFSMSGAIPGKPGVTFGGNIHSHWNKEKKVLSVSIMGGGRKLAIDGAGGGIFVKQDLQLIGDKKLSVHVIAMGSGKGATIASCQLDRQG